MVVKNIFYLLKMVSFRCFFTILFIGISLPYSHIQAQDPDEEGEIFWEDEEEYEVEGGEGKQRTPNQSSLISRNKREAKFQEKEKE